MKFSNIVAPLALAGSGALALPLSPHPDPLGSPSIINSPVFRTAPGSGIDHHHMAGDLHTSTGLHALGKRDLNWHERTTGQKAAITIGMLAAGGSALKIFMEWVHLLPFSSFVTYMPVQ